MKFREGNTAAQAEHEMHRLLAVSADENREKA